MNLSVGGAVQDVKFAYDLLQEGNRIWPNETADTKGHSFDAAFIRIVKRKLMRERLFHFISPSRLLPRCSS